MSDQKIAKLLLADKFNEMPMLKSIFSSFITDSQISLSKHINAHLEIETETTMQINSLEYINSIKSNFDFLSIEYRFDGWNTESFYILLQKNVLYKMIEIILGGKNLEYSLAVQERGFSKIEEKIINSIVDVLSLNLQNVFLVADQNIKVIRKNINYKQYGYPELKDDMTCMARADITIKDVIGKIDIVIPYDVLLPMKTSLMKSFSNKKLIQQDVWKKHMKDVVSVMHLQLTVEVDSIQTISDFEKMQVGDTIITNKHASEAFDVKINGFKVGDCKLGKVSEKLAVEFVNSII